MMAPVCSANRFNACAAFVAGMSMSYSGSSARATSQNIIDSRHKHSALVTPCRLRHFPLASRPLLKDDLQPLNAASTTTRLASEENPQDSCESIFEKGTRCA